jgi:hypothetical protein
MLYFHQSAMYILLYASIVSAFQCAAELSPTALLRVDACYEAAQKMYSVLTSTEETWTAPLTFSLDHSQSNIDGLQLPLSSWANHCMVMVTILGDRREARSNLRELARFMLTVIHECVRMRRTGGMAEVDDITILVIYSEQKNFHLLRKAKKFQDQSLRRDILQTKTYKEDLDYPWQPVYLRCFGRWY